MKLYYINNLQKPLFDAILSGYEEGDNFVAKALLHGLTDKQSRILEAVIIELSRENMSF